MSDHKYPAYQPTGSETLEKLVMDPNIPKSEAEWWACREITRLREQLHLANIDAIGAHAEANELRDRVITLSELLSEYMRACGSLVSPRIEKKAIAALEAKP